MHNRDQQIQNILNSLDGVQRASAGDFFYTRVTAALQKNRITTWDRISNLISRPAVAIATISMVLLINMAVLFNQSENVNTSQDPSELAMVEEYAFTTASIYDYENMDVK